MNDFRLSLGIEFDDKYIDAKNKLFESYEALKKLTDAQKQQLVIEFVKSVGMTAAFLQFAKYINNGGQI